MSLHASSLRHFLKVIYIQSYIIVHLALQHQFLWPFAAASEVEAGEAGEALHQMGGTNLANCCRLRDSPTICCGFLLFSCLLQRKMAYLHRTDRNAQESHVLGSFFVLYRIAESMASLWNLGKSICAPIGAGYRETNHIFGSTEVTLPRCRCSPGAGTA